MIQRRIALTNSCNTLKKLFYVCNVIVLIGKMATLSNITELGKNNPISLSQQYCNFGLNSKKAI